MTSPGCDGDMWGLCCALALAQHEPRMWILLKDGFHWHSLVFSDSDKGASKRGEEWFFESIGILIKASALAFIP